MDFHPIRPVKYDRASKAFNRQAYTMLSQWISTQFDHPIRLVEFDQHLNPLTGRHIQCNLNGFPPNSTGQIQLASKAFNRQAYTM